MDQALASGATGVILAVSVPLLKTGLTGSRETIEKEVFSDICLGNARQTVVECLLARQELRDVGVDLLLDRVANITELALVKEATTV